MIRRFAAVLALGLLLGCQHVTVTTPDGATIEGRSFGAGTTAVAPDGTVTTTSPGISEGVSGVVQYALGAVAAFFHVAPRQPTQIVVNGCGE